MIPGFSYLLAAVVIASLLAWAKKTSHKVSGEIHLFCYPKPIQWILLACIPIWIIAAAAVQITARPGIDSGTVIDIYVDLFLCASIGSGLLYAFAKRFYIAIDETSVKWRRFGTTRYFDFAKLDDIRFKKLNRGLERLSVCANGTIVLEVTSTIQDFGQLKMLMEHRARTYGIPIKTS